MMKLLRRVVEERGMTVVVVLHDINFASCYADHILAMKEGQMAHVGTPEAVVRNDVLSALYGFLFRCTRSWATACATTSPEVRPDGLQLKIGVRDRRRTP